MAISTPSASLLAMLPQVTHIKSALELSDLISGLSTEFSNLEAIPAGETPAGTPLMAYVLGALAPGDTEPESATRLHIMATPDEVVSAGVTWVAWSVKSRAECANCINSTINAIAGLIKLKSPASNSIRLPQFSSGESYPDLGQVSWVLPKKRDSRLSFSLHAQSAEWTLIATYAVVNLELLYRPSSARSQA